MTVYVNWGIKWAVIQKGGVQSYTSGFPDDAEDLTPYVKGFTLTRTADFGQAGEAFLEIELDNSDGSLTTKMILKAFKTTIVYFGKAVGTTPSPTITWSGAEGFYITDVDIQDDGFNSTVTVYARDYLNVLERYGLSDVSISGENAQQAMMNMIANNGGTSPPPWGADEWDIPVGVSFVNVTIGDVTLQFPDGLSIAEIIRQVCAAHLLLMFPITRVPYYTQVLTSFGNYTFARLFLSLITAISPNQLGDGFGNLFFSDPETIATGRVDPDNPLISYYDLLPFRALNFGVDIDRVTTIAHARNTSSESSSSSNSTSLASYGARGSRLVELPPSTTGSGTSQEFLDEMTSLQTRWWDAPEVHVSSLEVSKGMVEQYCDDEAVPAVSALFGGGLWYRCFIDVAGAGGTSTTTEAAFLSSTLYVTPTEWVIRLENGISGSQAFGFILNDDTLGVLDEDKL